MDKGGDKIKLVIVEWVDSAFLSGWVNKDVAIEHTISKCVSVGILIYQDKVKITLVNGISDTQNVTDGISIPVVSIKRIRELKVRS